MSSYERTGWRCQDISRRHREWGTDCPACDLDFLMVEYNHGLPVAIAEYKHHKVTYPINLNHPTYRAIRALADLTRLPFFLAFYWPESWAFYIVSVNEYARRIYGESMRLPEYRFVKSLYYMRQIKIREHVLEQLNRVDLPEDVVLPTIIRPKVAA